MTRRPLNFVTLLSLVLSVAVVALVVGGVLRVRYARLLPQVDEYVLLDTAIGTLPRAVSTEYTIPGWMLILALAVPPAIALRAARRMHQPQIGHCAHCGYDLRATPDRCPECGANPAPAPTAV
jgi:hypothetical protein